MFIVRSLFWLTAAFLVIAPQADFEQTARNAPWAAFNATQSALAQHVPNLACESFECVAARTMLASAASGARPAPASSTPSAPLSPPQTMASVSGDPIGALIASQPSPEAQAPLAGEASQPTPLRRPATLL